MKKFIKVEIEELERAFRVNSVSGIARGVYMAMGMKIKEKNSRTIQAGFKELAESSGFDRKSVMKAIRELEGVFIERSRGIGGQSNTYKLLVGIYNGKKEELNDNAMVSSQESSGPYMHKTMGVNVDLQASPNTDLSHVRAYNTNLFTKVNNSNKEQQQEQKHVVVFNNLEFNFKEHSHFRAINKKTLMKWSRIKGPEFVQSAINKADDTYGPKASVLNPAGLLRNHVFLDYDLTTKEEQIEILKEEKEAVRKEKHKKLNEKFQKLDEEYFQLAKYREDGEMIIEEGEQTDLYLEAARTIQKTTKYEIGSDDYEFELMKKQKELKRQIHKKMLIEVFKKRKVVSK